MQELRIEAEQHYRSLLDLFADYGYIPPPSSPAGCRHPIDEIMNEYDRTNPGLDAWQLKAELYRVTAENFRPVIFRNAPFYFATDLLPGHVDGRSNLTPCGWLFRRNQHLYRDADPDTYDRFYAHMKLRLYLCCGPYVDRVHYCYPTPNVVRFGLKHFYQDAEAALERCENEEERTFIKCAMTGLLATRRMSERFADAAAEQAKTLTDPTQLRFMRMIEKSARNVPWNKPEHFYEGLNTLWFCRDVMGVLDALGNSSLSRPDYLLYDLYRNDIDSGFMTKEEAYDFVRRFIVLGDCHYDKDVTVVGGADHELEMGVVLGGCDEQGTEVFNDITAMFLQAHREAQAIFPKLHCRYGRNSSKAYLDEIDRDFLAGRSVTGLSNDDSIIPALINDGKPLADARGYVNTGCWSAIVEGKESISGGNYFYMFTLIELMVHGIDDRHREAGVRIDPFDGCESFEEVYQRFLENALGILHWRCQAIGKYGRLGPRVNPAPLYSACMENCLEKRKDFFAGGSKYNINEIAPSGFANAIDSLLAIKSLCFDQKSVSLTELLDAVRANWEGQEALRQQALHCPHFGDLGEESVSLSRRLHNDLYNHTRDLVNERGGTFSINYILYREFLTLAKTVRATPDGRRLGDLLSLGIGPSRYHSDPLPAVTQSAGSLDPEKCLVSAIDVQLPGGNMSLSLLENMVRSFAAVNLKHIQLNCVNLDELRDAQVHPEAHQDLVVRVCGFSAKFVALSPQFQEEFISRTVYQ